MKKRIVETAIGPIEVITMKRSKKLDLSGLQPKLDKANHILKTAGLPKM